MFTSNGLLLLYYLFFLLYSHLLFVLPLFIHLFQIFCLRWIDWHIYLCLLPILLLCTLWYVRIHADLIFLWIHGLHLLWFLPHAWNHRFPCSFAIRPSHLPVHQVWVVSWSLPGGIWYVSFFFPHFFRRRFVEKGIMGSFVVPCVFKPEAGFKSRSSPL